MPEHYIYIDLYDTVIKESGKPLPHAIERIKELKKLGFKLVLWSDGGHKVCKEVANRLGLDYCFDVYLTKPIVIIDDMAKDISFPQARLFLQPPWDKLDSEGIAIEIFEG